MKVLDQWAELSNEVQPPSKHEAEWELIERNVSSSDCSSTWARRKVSFQTTRDK